MWHLVAIMQTLAAVYLVLLLRGEKADELDGDALAKLQREHLAHMDKLAKDGTILVAGPFDEQDDDRMRGLCLYRAKSKADARRLAEADPAVKAGRLQVQVQRWWFEKDAVQFPTAEATPPAP